MAREAIHDLALEPVDPVAKTIAVAADHRPDMMFPSCPAVENRLDAGHGPEDLGELALDLLDLADSTMARTHETTSTRDLGTV
jgi:hypothetical protein